MHILHCYSICHRGPSIVGQQTIIVNSWHDHSGDNKPFIYFRLLNGIETGSECTFAGCADTFEGQGRRVKPVKPVVENPVDPEVDSDHSSASRSTAASVSEQFLDATIIPTISAFLHSSPGGVLSSSSGSAQAPAPARLLDAVNGPTQLFSVVAQKNKTTFVLTDDAKAVFQLLTGPVYVISIYGLKRLGKSTHLSFFVREW